MAIADGDYFADLLLGVETHQAELDAALADCLDRPLETVDDIARATLRLGAYELLHRIDVPYKVVINEAVELARDFGSEGGHTYVNGVLDQLARRARAAVFARRSCRAKKV